MLAYAESRHWVHTNVYLGVSVEDQATAEERMPLLCAIPRPWKLFVSYEPALGPVTFRPEWLERIDWLIIGGESGPGARPFYIDWINPVRDACREIGTAFFVKQYGSNPYIIMDTLYAIPFKEWTKEPITGKGNHPDEWMQNHRVRELPPDIAAIMALYGKAERVTA